MIRNHNPELTAPPAQALQVCRDITRQHSKTFYLGSTFFPPKQRQAVWAVYATCRTGDDLADETPAEDAPHALEQWWEDTRSALQGHPGADHISQALSWAAHHYPLPHEAFHELYLGLKMDLDQVEYQTLADLELYCRRVAGIVGLMVSPICGYVGGEKTLQKALKLGMAMQLTNILRDVGEDLYQRDRVYLPADLLNQYGVTREMLRQGKVTPEYHALMKHLIQMARGWYQEGRNGLPCLQGSGRLAVAVAARAYEGILDALERNGYDNFQQRAQVSGLRKLLMVPSAWWSLRHQTSST
ncbi:phytoene/squalene synthase family protein [Deinococcus cellulosilyticus]|uniref:Phytoene synthase n=1 Tax=Deinococcus cellulosilyticus (strain DSM 18568 / NBRC 106333 / KACC 11606 / 5516J-15) TaxID=1223518 RepID=A0A511MXM6_DEIC1|nr:phytoene/squalene synthase family protein [Deinococcus cellulosilyticus]GEM44886.1 phytoene synthase [Deinococcus cellulosilyticus NBRC 106333 = KACC 11606]